MGSCVPLPTNIVTAVEAYVLRVALLMGYGSLMLVTPGCSEPGLCHLASGLCPPRATKPEHAMKQVAFQSSNGDVTRLGDALCWRFLESRPCLPAAERRVAASVDVVIIPVMPASSPQQHIPSTSDGTIILPAAAQGETSTGATGCTPPAPTPALVPSPAAVREQLLRACSSAANDLGAFGLRVAVDDCPKATPGAKYNLWENRGVRLRVEVGMREVASGRFCLVLHPSSSSLLPGARAAAESVEHGISAPLPDGRAQLPGAGQGPTGHSTGGRVPRQRPGLRLPALSLQALAAACKHVTSAATGATSGSTRSQGGAVCSSAAPGTHAGPHGHGRCQKLHLWPDAVSAAAADPVAAIISQLRASYGLPPKSPARGTSGGGPPGDALAAAPALHMAQEADTREATAETQVQTCGGVTAAAAAAPGAAPIAFRPCVAHLRHLLQLGRACHCGQGHCTLQELQQEVAVRYAESNRDTGAEVAAWILPAALQQQEQQQKGRPRGRQGSTSNAGAARGAEDQGLLGGCEDGSAAPGSEDGYGGGGGPGRVVLLVGGIPPRVPHGAVQAALAAAFQPFGCLGGKRQRYAASHASVQSELGCQEAVYLCPRCVRLVRDRRTRPGKEYLSLELPIACAPHGCVARLCPTASMPYCLFFPAAFSGRVPGWSRRDPRLGTCGVGGRRDGSRGHQAPRRTAGKRPLQARPHATQGHDCSSSTPCKAAKAHAWPTHIVREDSCLPYTL